MRYLRRISFLALAATGAAALAAAGAMPADMSGFSAAAAARQADLETRFDADLSAAEIREHSPATRVIVLTGSEAPRDVSRARSAGVSGYVTKDQIAGDLVRAILEAAAI